MIALNNYCSKGCPNCGQDVSVFRIRRTQAFLCSNCHDIMKSASKVKTSRASTYETLDGVIAPALLRQLRRDIEARKPVPRVQ